MKTFYVIYADCPNYERYCIRALTVRAENIEIARAVIAANNVSAECDESGGYMIFESLPILDETFADFEATSC